MSTITDAVRRQIQASDPAEAAAYPFGVVLAFEDHPFMDDYGRGQCAGQVADWCRDILRIEDGVGYTSRTFEIAQVARGWFFGFKDGSDSAKCERTFSAFA